MTAPRPSVDDHAARVRDLLAPVLARRERESLPLADALGLLAATDLRSPVDLPLFRNSQMDGFAVRAADLRSVPVRLRVIGDQPAGAGEPAPLEPGCARRIMTGAIVPRGADCVVPVEDTDARFGPGAGSAAPAEVLIRVAREPGEFVREPGSDVRAGELLIPAGTRLAPRHLAALAAAGYEDVAIRRRLRVAVITTGSELTSSPSSTDPGLIFDSNSVALLTAVREAGAGVCFAGVSTDDPGRLRDLLERAVEAGADLIVTSGGISAGAFEVVREVLEPLGGRMEAIRMQPGGPQGTARYRDVPVVAFPGNPVSTQISFAVFLRPLLRKDAGLDPVEPGERVLLAPVESVAGKRQFLRGREAGLSPAGDEAVEVVSGASSHLVAGMARADLLIEVPEEAARLEAGASVRVWML